MEKRKGAIIGHHLILHGYGHWLPNDPRGSGSEAVAQEKLRDLGPVHHGRKKVQPPREALRAFYREATPRLDYVPLWFDVAKRQAIGEAFGEVVRRCTYTVWECGILKNHAHLCIRRHRDSAETMWGNLAQAARQALLRFPDVTEGHPIWSNRPYKVFLWTPDDVRGRIAYIRRNPAKDELDAQAWPFVVPYDGWPFHKRSSYPLAGSQLVLDSSVGPIYDV